MKTVLLIEDDEVSLRFMAEAISLLPVQLHASYCFADAMKLIQLHTFDLIISDINLGDGTLYQFAPSFPTMAKKIATSADVTPATITRLKSAGITAVLAKPMGIAELHQAITLALEITQGTKLESPLWDTAHALQVLGNNLESLLALKNMFKVELPIMLQQIDQDFNTGDFSKVSDTLHKLKASCGFLGAQQLLAECHTFDSNMCLDSLQHFQRVAKQTLNSI